MAAMLDPAAPQNIIVPDAASSGASNATAAAQAASGQRVNVIVQLNVVTERVDQTTRRALSTIAGNLENTLRLAERNLNAISSPPSLGECLFLLVLTVVLVVGLILLFLGI